MTILTKIFRCFLLLTALYIPNLATANSYSAISYTITPILINKPYLKIEATIKGKFSDNVLIDLPNKWADAYYSKQIRNIRLIHPPKKTNLPKNNKNQVTISTNKTDTIKLSYEVHQKPNNPSDVKEVLIKKDLIHTPGYGIFAVPNALINSDKKIIFDIEWKNIYNWKTMSSYGINESMHFDASAPKLLHAIYIAGNLRIHQIVANPNSPVYLSLYGNFDLEDDQFISNMTEIIKTQRAFFNDHDFPHYVISLTEGDDPYNMGGTGLHNSFAAYLPKKANKLSYYILLAHEHFHNWTGGKIQYDEKEGELNYWWTEGFTDYYSRILAFLSGGLSAEEFTHQCNEILKKYYLSPVLNVPNKKIKSDFWKNNHVQQLPYHRGFVFAIYLNYLIKKNNPKYSLDNVMLDLLKNIKNKKLTSNFFKEIAKPYIHNIDSVFAEYITDGKTIDLKELSVLLPIEKITAKTADIGFDLQKSTKDKTIRKLNKKSNAYKAGLRNGDKIISLKSLHPESHHPDQMVSIETTNKIFKFKPNFSNDKDLYQFKSNLSQQDITKIKNFCNYSAVLLN